MKGVPSVAAPAAGVMGDEDHCKSEREDDECRIGRLGRESCLDLNVPQERDKDGQGKARQDFPTISAHLYLQEGIECPPGVVPARFLSCILRKPAPKARK
jgi:hypothetical protein